MCCNVLMGDKAAIKNVKYRYLRALDTKHWDDFADTLTDDIVGDYGSSLGESLRFTNRADLVDYMRSTLGAALLTEHRVTQPEITVTGDRSEERRVGRESRVRRSDRRSVSS